VIRRALRRRYYDLFARVYDRFVAWHSGEPTGPMRRALAERASSVSVRRVLDVCCGTGAVTRALRQRLGEGSLVVGLDFSRGMLGRGIQAARLAGVSCIRWVQADAAALPFKSGIFDAATCAYALYELKGTAREEMLWEVARVMTPGGRFLAMEHEVPTRPFPRLLFHLRLAVIGAEGARAFLGGEVQELVRVFGQASKEFVPPGKSKILTGLKSLDRVESQESRAESRDE
jgi:demethylmenaquinone methyltransferase/2-methoxy-6-polyprenyl-1,4-benzoquinol methylase